MVMNAIINRKSVRKYSDKPIPDDVLAKILEAGRLAPSWVNVQSWKFVVVTNQEVKDILCEASGGQKQVKTAQAVICCVADLDDWSNTKFGKVIAEKGVDEATITAYLSSKTLNPANLGEYEVLLRSVEQVTYAVAYMTLEAQELGVGACIVGAFANELTKSNVNLTKKVKAALGLNDKQILVDMITLGYELAPKDAKKFRKEAKDVIFFEKI